MPSWSLAHQSGCYETSLPTKYPTESILILIDGFRSFIFYCFKSFLWGLIFDMSEERSTFLNNLHQSFREELLQRESNFTSELAILAAGATGFVLYMFNCDRSNPLLYLIAMGGSILVGLLGVIVSKMHGYQFRFCLFQLHKIEYKLGVCDVPMKQWHRYCDYLYALKKKYSAQSGAGSEDNRFDIKCEKEEIIDKSARYSSKKNAVSICDKRQKSDNGFADPFSIKPPNIINTFRIAFVIFIAIVVLCSFIIALRGFECGSDKTEMAWGRCISISVDNTCVSFFLITVIVFLAVLIEYRVHNNLKSKFCKIIEAEFTRKDSAQNNRL